MGPEVGELEAKLAQFVAVQHCVSCANGTDALLMALMAYGIGNGDAVFVPSFTFIATAEIVPLLGATPIFVDIDPTTFNLNPAHLEDLLNSFPQKFSNLKPRAIIPVDLFGQPADYNEIMSIAKKNGLMVIEDAAQSFGATYFGKRAGALGDSATTSFFPAKPLGCYGDGGAIFCADEAYAATLKSVRVHGQGKQRYEHIRIGINGRLDTLQAAILLAKLEIFEEELSLRDKVARRYNELLKGKDIVTPVIGSERTSAWAQYSLLSSKRDTCMEALKAAGIPAVVYYPIPLHLQKAFSHLGYKKGSLPVCEKIAGEIFSLPMHPYLDAPTQERIVRGLERVTG